MARQLRAPFPCGVWLVPLAELTQPDLLPMTVLSALTQARTGTGLPELIDYIGDRQLLLILDSCSA